MLQKAVSDKQSAVQNQLNNVKTNMVNLIITAAITLTTVIGTYLLKILYYWVVAAFLLIFFWIVIEIVMIIIAPKYIYSSKDLRKSLLSNLKSSGSSTYALFVIYLIALIPLFLIATNVIKTNTPFAPLIPLIAVILSAIISAISPTVALKFAENDNFFKYFYELYKISGEHTNKQWEAYSKEPEQLKRRNILIGASFILFTIIIIIFYIFAFLKALVLINNIPILILFLGAQLLISLFIQRYVNIEETKKELSDTIDNLNKINEQINKIFMDKNYSQIKYDELRNKFSIAQKYYINLNNVLKFIQLYRFTINEDYFDCIFN